MSDPEVTETNHARLARESRERMRGTLPRAEGGSVAEAFGYEAIALGGALPKGDQRQGTTGERTEWLEWRRTGIGASDIGSICGWGFSSPYKVWAEKVGLIGSDEDNDAFRFGRRMEPVLGRWFEDETGLYVHNEQARRVHSDHPIALATIDGEVYERPGLILPDMDAPGVPLGGLEIKTAGVHGWKADDPIPLGYQAQGQWSMFAGAMWFAVLHGRLRYEQPPTPRTAMLWERRRALA
jgi:putative phage-type endonuclease